MPRQCLRLTLSDVSWQTSDRICREASRPAVGGKRAPPINTKEPISVHPLDQYLTHLRVIRNNGAGTPETFYYPPPAELLNAIGHALKPELRAVNQHANINIDRAVTDGSGTPQSCSDPEIIDRVISNNRAGK